MNFETSSRVSFAEGLLSLVTSKDRAASIAGDLAEEAGSRCGVWFWVDLLSVALALFSQAFRLAPWRSSWLIVSGLILWFVLYTLLRALGALLGLHALDTSCEDCGTLSVSAYVYFAVTLVVSNFLAGLVMGWRSRVGRPNACTPLAVFWVVSAIVAAVVDAMLVSGTGYCSIVYLIGLPLLYVAPLLYGGAIAGRRQLA
jgi:hypothetical protein